MPNNKFDRCGLCGDEHILTFEHVPPKCAFNNKNIHIQKHEHLIEQNSPLYGKKSRSNKGFGKYSLCSSCNNNTGNWYANAFCDFAEQGMQILTDNKNPNYIKGEYIVKPHNVLKQIFMMFLTADSSNIIRDLPGVKDYLLNRKSQDFPSDINIYIYSNASKIKRMLGYHVVGDINNDKIFNWAEINFQPFGYVLTHKSEPPNEFMVKITDFRKVPYDEMRRLTLTTAYLKVDSPEIGYYSNL